MKIGLPRNGPHPIDIHVGLRLRLRRILLGLSQERLAEHLGISFQQIQKYETGGNRLSASRLHEAATLLDVPIAFFFDELPASLARGPSRNGARRVPARSGRTTRHVALDDDLHSKRETLELVRAYYRIGDPNVRGKLRGLIEKLAAMEPGR